MSEDKDTQPLNVHIAVENFGPIEKAEIDLRPLTVFVGENNTGKTYLAALIYALHPSFEGSAKWIQPQDEPNLKLGKIFSHELKECFNLKSVSELKRFSDNLSDKLSISLKVCYDSRSALEMDWTCDSKHVGSAKISTVFNEKLEIKETEMLWHRKNEKIQAVYYIPAARRGIMLTYKTFANLLVADKINFSFERIGISKWISDFLKQIIHYDEDRTFSDEMLNIAKALENEVIHGKIVVNRPAKAAYPEIFYRPQNTKEKLQISHTSSMVSELAPLVLFLRGVVKPGDTLIIEEPEAHLHPKAQTKVAIALAQLVRAGVRVIITTHSDWLLQQIGNLIREGELNKQEQDTSELPHWLSKEEVGAWWFHTDKPVEKIPFDRIEGIEPKDYEDVADGLYNNFVELERQFLKEEAVSEDE
ncbi:MAG: AAA family ATPase [Candidatus Poribacteria bacterium]|nr:AAA family ATPase [Candidatus Poribacteria bacterium]